MEGEGEKEDSRTRRRRDVFTKLGNNSISMTVETIVVIQNPR